MDYKSAYTKLLGLVDLERMRSATRFRKRYNLAKMEAILDRMGNPETRTPALHITGTKGKGSTAALCSSVLVSAGYHTGFYSSPHIHTFRERIRLDGVPVSPMSSPRWWSGCGPTLRGSPNTPVWVERPCSKP